MKNLIISSLLLLLAFGCATAQDFAPVGATWHYDNWSAITFFGDGYITLENNGDTIIEGKVCQRLLKTTYMYNGWNQTNSTTTSFEYVASQGDSVLNFKHGQSYLLYDFSAEAGDIWTVAGNEVCDEHGTVIVDSVAYEFFDGAELKCLYVRSPSDSPVQFSHLKIVEGIGCLGYMFPEPYCVTDSNLGGQLRCYSDNQSSFHFQNDVACDAMTLVGISDEHAAGNLKVFPTVFTDVLQIDGTSSKLIYQLFDMQGREVERGEISQTEQLNLGHVSSGSYILFLSSNKHFNSFNLLKP